MTLFTWIIKSPLKSRFYIYSPYCLFIYGSSYFCPQICYAPNIMVTLLKSSFHSQMSTIRLNLLTKPLGNWALVLDSWLYPGFLGVREKTRSIWSLPPTPTPALETLMPPATCPAPNIWHPSCLWFAVLLPFAFQRASAGSWHSGRGVNFRLCVSWESLKALWHC